MFGRLAGKATVITLAAAACLSEVYAEGESPAEDEIISFEEGVVVGVVMTGICYMCCCYAFLAARCCCKRQREREPLLPREEAVAGCLTGVASLLRKP
ncbi:MAG: hypothetical protein EPO11_00485 [Gammaproteobacteria bacterium]|nr:MAG: hypothetical protein EPO11_00485 [Gammaproteobacteria bacterium]